MVKEIEVKKALRKGVVSDPMFGALYSVSPYGGCEHGCVYCDGRAEKYFVEGDFEKDLVARMNVPELLQHELETARERAPIGLGSGITDVYQPIEKEYQLTRKCGEVLTESPFPVSILTKSSLILRDLDIWSAVQKRSGFHLKVSLTTLDDSVRRDFEPSAASVEERIEVIRRFKEIGCTVGIFMMPFLPGISDSVESIGTTVSTLSELGVDYVTPGYLTLRPGRQKEFYMKMISEKYPSLLPLYESLYVKELVSGNPAYNYRTNCMKMGENIFGDMPQFIPHSCYRNTMPIYHEIGILLFHMIQLYEQRSVDVTSLKQAFHSYTEWCETEKRTFNRKRSLHGDAIDELLAFHLRCGGFESVISNKKLLAFITAVALDRKVFNYNSLKLM